MAELLPDSLLAKRLVDLQKVIPEERAKKIAENLSFKQLLQFYPNNIWGKEFLLKKLNEASAYDLLHLDKDWVSEDILFFYLEKNV